MALNKLDPPLDRPKHRIILAFDLGTTFSGIGWALTDQNAKEIKSASQIEPRTIQQWPDKASFQGQTSEKVPTELSHRRPIPEWGHQIEHDTPRDKWFKLNLDPEAVSDSKLSTLYIRHCQKQDRTSQEAAELVILYLTELRKHADQMLKLHLGEGVLATTPRSYIVTVPAMWSPAAMHRTRVCAEKAGLGHSVRLISEPEAAVIHGLSTTVPQKLKVTDKFVVVDAGGGTVDLISYVIDQLEPRIKVREVVRGAGSVCGATFLNHGFEDFLTRRLSSARGWSDMALDFALDQFENVVKKKFSGLENDPYNISVPGVYENKILGVKRGFYRISITELKDIFEPVVSSILTVLAKQMELMVGSPKAILLVGGFGQSPYLRERIKEFVGPFIDVMQPPHAQTAVVRGAVMKGISELAPDQAAIQIASRIARKSYGYWTGAVFQTNKHEDWRKYWEKYSGLYRIGVMETVVKKGHPVIEKDPSIFELYDTRLVANGPLTDREITIYTHDNAFMDQPPIYKDKGWKPLAKLRADLSSIRADIPIVKGSDGKMHYRMDYEIRVAFFSAHTEYSLWYNDKCYGTVDAEYV